ncbi:MAG: VWA domain-containing protein [Prevotella sp.]|nr:VWA domain-containing protein [Prevotella sp.]
MKSKEKRKTKAQVFNVIILDKSGSMGSIRQAAVDGFNETLAGIKRAQERYADTQDHFVSLLTFCDCEKRYVYNKVPAAKACPLTPADYQPCCCTPLYDAMGFTLTSMRKYIAAIEDHVVVVTIITDGLENSSKEYTGAAVKQLVEELKKEGWTFTYMGANQNSVEVAFNISIRNSVNFVASSAGMKNTMARDSQTRMNFFDRLADYKHAEFNDQCTPASAEERHESYCCMADEAFDEEENKC